MERNLKGAYDVIIIGAGPSGIFCAYTLIEARPDLRILMIEKGRPIEKRVCPKRKTKVCVGCKPCNITTGFAGAGAFSDGKLSLSMKALKDVAAEEVREEKVVLPKTEELTTSLGELFKNLKLN